MALEAQSVAEEDEREQREHMVRRLLDSAGSVLWDEP
jgi:hypothetical protein